MEKLEIADLSIIKYPDPRLRQPCRTIEHFNSSLADLAGRMLTLMREGGGVGLAAPQLGLSVRLFVCNATGESEDDEVYVNSVLDDLSGNVEAEEGCLCLPGVVGPITRARKCVIRAVDLQGNPVERSGEDLKARIWQHETDHLDGRLIIDRMSPAAQIANRRALKHLEQQFHSTDG
ncbi:MAG TPA: peptide deformylase [Phycisphaerae bacterium]|nr:peptide deformylase [Phycisphaerae bacterium]